jgi:ribosomal protein S18 acetylase RimI-like enzyme
MSVHIRPADVADAKEIAEVQVAAWRETYPGLLPQSMLDNLSVPRSAHGWSRQLAEPATTVLLAETEAGVIGFGSRCPQRSGALLLERFDGEVSSLYVLKAWQGQGHGGRLLSALFDHLRADGFESASLWVLSGNAPARGFYERMGGAVIAERKDRSLGRLLSETAYGWRKLARRGPAEPLFKL